MYEMLGFTEELYEVSIIVTLYIYDIYQYKVVLRVIYVVCFMYKLLRLRVFNGFGIPFYVKGLGILL